MKYLFYFIILSQTVLFGQNCDDPHIHCVDDSSGEKQEYNTNEKRMYPIDEMRSLVKNFSEMEQGNRKKE